ncbi:MAG: DUF305 domain-containing protein [Ruminococcus sp.]|nr:DUF305 domain-containing protein [Ruminococcus sp.]MCM1382769.1 DUF305 domain-containing protein [Muribaculaceae bacterium]MCM1480072.1 DUF305 domain-containing protein [Muribaculaceae bacterium]
MSRLSEETCQYLETYRDILRNMIMEMNNAELGCSISHNFILQMLPHHQAAIEMSENILKFSNNSNIRRIAENIIDEQTASVEALRSVEDVTKSLLNCRADLRQYQCCICEIMRKMFCCMKTAAQTDCVDKNFLCEMIPHHRGAVQMSCEALKNCLACELRPILQDIVRSQKKGINEMCCLLKCF